MPIRPPWFFLKRNSGPAFYHMTCTKCDFEKEYELARDYTVVHNPDCDETDSPEVVEELPKVCPKCGAKLKKEKIPVKIVY